MSACLGECSGVYSLVKWGQKQVIKKHEQPLPSVGNPKPVLLACPVWVSVERKVEGSLVDSAPSRPGNHWTGNPELERASWAKLMEEKGCFGAAGGGQVGIGGQSSPDALSLTNQRRYLALPG